MLDIWTENPNAETIETLIAFCTKKAGGDDAETVLAFTKDELAEGYVVVHASRLTDAARLLARCGSAVSAFRVDMDSVDLRIRTRNNGKRIFRGIEFAFAPVDKEKTPWNFVARESEEVLG